jgi:hypothetical protein
MGRRAFDDGFDARGADVDAEERRHYFLSIKPSAAAAVFSSVTSTPPMRPRSAAAMIANYGDTLLFPQLAN